MKRIIASLMCAMLFTLPAIPQEFTVVVIPDTQFYHVNYSYDGSGATIQDFHTQLDWVVDNVAVRNIAFVSHLGDITENGSQMSEWHVSSDIMGKIEDLVPYGLCAGNHDADSWSPVTHGPWSRGYNNFTSVFGEDRYAHKEWYGDDYPDGTNWNSYQLFSGGGIDFVIIHIECWPPQDVIDWADGVLAQYPNRKAIISSHDHTGEIMGLARKHANCFMFNRGHIPGEAHNEVVGDHGHVIHDLLVDYQGWHRGGNGFFRYYTFKPSENQVCATTYSNTTKETRAQFCFDVNFDGTFLSLSQVGEIVEGAEDGGIIIVELTNDEFVSNLNPANWTVENLPDGVTMGSVARLGTDQAQITLSGNSTIGTYNTNIANVKVTIGAAELLEGNSDVSSSSGVLLTMAPQSIPGMIQAESYSAMNGIQLEATTDIDGGQNVGYIDAGDWMAYDVNVKASTTYQVDFRVAAQSNVGQIQIQSDDVTIKTIDLVATGGWQNWQTVSTTLDLIAGDQTLKVLANNEGFNINWMDFHATTPLSDPIVEDVAHQPVDPSPRDDVTVSASIADDVEVTAATINWGTALSALNNQVVMTASGDVWTGNIPAQADGVVIYYTVTAEDGDGNTSSSVANSFTVFDPLVVAPEVSSVTNMPNSPNSTEVVAVTAIVTDNISVASVKLMWGTAEDQMTNELLMAQDVDVYSAVIPEGLNGTSVFYQVVAEDGDGNVTASMTHVYDVSDKTTFNSYDVEFSDGSVQASIVSGGVTAHLEFYESANDDGVEVGQVFSQYNSGAHPDGFNKTESYWTNGVYPYVGRSTVARGEDDGESNVPSPAGVKDLQIHSPSNDHLTVAAFEVPLMGYYNVTNLGIRRVSPDGGQASLKVFDSQMELIAVVTANNDRAWSLDDTDYELGSLMPGQKIYFAVDNVDDFSFDATEVTWTIEQSDVITAVSTVEAEQARVYFNPDNGKYVVAGVRASSYEVLDVSGRVKQVIPPSQAFSELDLAGLSSGVYFLKINLGPEQSVTRKLFHHRRM